jgi:hypothetical protein
MWPPGVIGDISVRVVPLDPDPETRAAETEDRDGQ